MGSKQRILVARNLKKMLKVMLERKGKLKTTTKRLNWMVANQKMLVTMNLKNRMLKLTLERQGKLKTRKM